MMYFALDDHLRASILYFILGALCGASYKPMNTVSDFIKQLIVLPYNAWRTNSPFFNKTDCPRFKISTGQGHVSDFFFFLVCGLAFTTLSYITLDCAVRLHNIIIFILSFIIIGRLVSEPFCILLSKLFSIIYRCIFFFMYFILLPLKCIFIFLGKLLLPTIRYAKLRSFDRAVQKLTKREATKISDTVLSIE